MSKGSILVVDDEAEIREGLELLLDSEGYKVSTAGSAGDGLARLEEQPFDLLLLDVSLPDHNGLELLPEIRRRDPSLSVVLITAYGSVDMARTAFKNGAQDYITKPWSNDELLAQVALAVEGRRLREENVQLKRALKQRYDFPNIIGKSEKIVAVLDLVKQVAPSRSTVLITGESGTGKELIAKAIHSASPRADKAFVPVNSGSIPVDLLESQLFGHVKGAFTGAIASKKGLFEVADQGTIFFDEISAISHETQAKLLRVIQEREFMRLGGTETIKVDVRILAACNTDLLRLVREGRFREDLFHRLNVISVKLPPLRERRQDVPLLLDFFLRRICAENNRPVGRFSPEALKLLTDYDWPGNIRELENVVERAVVLSAQELIDANLLPESVRIAEPTAAAADAFLANAQAARIAGISPPELYAACFADAVRSAGSAPFSEAQSSLAELFASAEAALGLSSPPLPGEPGARLAADNPAPSLVQIMEAAERRIICEMLERTGWNQTEAAERFQIPLSTLNQKIKRLGIRRAAKPSAAPDPTGK